MDGNRARAEAAGLFKVLGNESRLALLDELGQKPRSVSELVELTAMSQPLVSQHLRTLRQAGIVESHRHGKEIIYELSDVHVRHIVDDALEHVREVTDHIAHTNTNTKEPTQ